MELVIFIGYNGVRFELCEPFEEEPESLHNSENWQIVKEEELPVIMENIMQIQDELGGKNEN